MIEESAIDVLTETGVRDAVASYAASLGLEGAGFNEQQRLDLTIEGQSASFCFIGGERAALWIGCEIGTLDPDDRDALIWLLGAGMKPWMLRGERIGLIPQTATAVTYTVLDAAYVAADTLEEIVNALIESAAHLKNVLDGRNFISRPN